MPTRRILVCLVIIAIGLAPAGLFARRVADTTINRPASTRIDALAPSIVYTANPMLTITDNTYAGGFGPGMACSTINTTSTVPAGTVVSSVSITLQLMHTWVGDLTVKLRSPAGTILTVLNRPGSNAPDTGADTPVGDSSDWPGGTSIAFGDGLGPEAETMGAGIGAAQNICLDNGVCAHDPSPDTAVVPPAGFSGLNDEVAGGIWTLCIGDGAAQDIGTFQSWSLNLTHASVFTATPGSAIPDDGYVGGFGGPTQSCSTISVPVVSGGPSITHAPYIDLDILHTRIGDLTAKLRSPNNTILTIVNRPGSTAADNGADTPLGDTSNWDGFLQFRDGIGPEAETMGSTIGDAQAVCTNDGICRFDSSPDTATQPPANLGAFVGGPISGDWTLCVADSAPANTGIVRSWRLKLPEALAPTAAAVTVSGRVMTQLGSSIGKARVTLARPDGTVRVALTNAFGSYLFDEVTVGETYLVTVEAKGYSFDPRTVTVADEVNGLDFIGQSSFYYKQE